MSLIAEVPKYSTERDLRGKIQDKLFESDWCDALYLGGSLLMLVDGSYVFNYLTVGEFALNIALRAYSRDTGNPVFMTAADILAAIENGTLEREALDDYVSWFSLGVEGPVRDYEGKLKVACKKVYGKDKDPETLSYNEMLMLESFFE